MKLVLGKTLNGRILDIGGGGEGIIGRLYGDQVIAIDNRQEELDEAPDGFEKVLMDATALSFEDAVFDHVTSFYTLMYMQRAEQEKALREAARVLKPGGSLYIWDTDIVSAYPEPFYAQIEVEAAQTQIRTTYGVVKMDAQDDRMLIALCEKAGLLLKSAKKQDGHFVLHFVR